MNAGIKMAGLGQGKAPEAPPMPPSNISVPDLNPTSNTVGIEWSPVAAGERLSFRNNTFTSVGTALINTFGPFPITLEMKDHAILMAMARAANEEMAVGGPYYTLADAVARYAVVQLRTIE